MSSWGKSEDYLSWNILKLFWNWFIRTLYFCTNNGSRVRTKRLILYIYFLRGKGYKANINYNCQISMFILFYLCYYYNVHEKIYENKQGIGLEIHMCSWVYMWICNVHILICSINIHEYSVGLSVYPNSDKIFFSISIFTLYLCLYNLETGIFNHIESKIYNLCNYIWGCLHKIFIPKRL